jgi:hypothetical protein
MVKRKKKEGKKQKDNQVEKKKKKSRGALFQSNATTEIFVLSLNKNKKDLQVA